MERPKRTVRKWKRKTNEKFLAMANSFFSCLSRKFPSTSRVCVLRHKIIFIGYKTLSFFVMDLASEMEVSHAA